MFLQCQLAMITLGAAAAIGAVSVGGKQKAKTDGPPINATSKDEEKFIQYAHSQIVYAKIRAIAEADMKGNRDFLDNADKEGQPAKH